MKQIRMGEYLSPAAEVLGLRYEGVLCESVGKNYEESTNQGYTSSDDLFEIF